MFKALTQTFFEESIKFIQYNENIPNEAVYAINEITNRFVKCNFICTSLPFTAEDKIKMLEQEKLSERLIEALKALHKEQKLLYLQNEIRNKTQFDLRRTAEGILPEAAESRTSRKSWAKAKAVRKRRNC